MKLKRLYRPIGISEYLLIRESGYQQYPPRLSWQPIFYPVTNKEYAEQIAETWNTKDEFSGYCGLVTTFQIANEFLAKYPIKNVGGAIHDEYWIPADELALFNDNIVGNIEVIQAFFGEKFSITENTVLMKYYEKYR